MFLEKMIFWLLGFLSCYIIFYIRSKKKMLDQENYPRTLLIIILLTLAAIIFRYFIYVYKGI